MSTKSHGRFIWFDLMTRDVDRALGFYGELFGWKHQHVDMGGGTTYTILELDGQQVGGLMKLKDHETPPMWNVYFSTRDTDATADLVPTLGGKVLSPPHDIPNVGRFAVLMDPRGTAFSVLASLAEKPEGDSKPGEFCWAEANVDEPGAVSSFYMKVFGWDVRHREFEGFETYHEFTRGEAWPAAGLTRKSGSFPNMWLNHVRVADCEQTVRRAARLGAMVLAPTVKIETIGSIAVLQDPTGAVFGIFQR